MDKKEFDECKEMYSSPREYVDCIPVGWSKLYLDMIDEMDKVAGPDNYYIVEVKEKYGELRTYFHCVDHYEDYEAITSFYEDLSHYTCCNCGKPATKMSIGYILPYCDEHAPDGSIPLEPIKHVTYDSENGFIEAEIDERLDRMLKHRYGRDDYQNMLAHDFEKWVEEEAEKED